MPGKAAAPLARPARARVFVVDDHPIVRQGLAQLINQECDLIVCGEASDSYGALESILKLNPDIIIADISLEGADGIDLLKTIRMRDVRIPVLILSMHDEALYAERALRAGAMGYIMKQEATDKFLLALRAVLRGDIYVSDRMAAKMLRQFVKSPERPTTSPIELLSDRELEVFRLIGQGRGTREIATELHLSVKTVEAYRAHIKEKMTLSTATELVRHAVQWVETERVR
jgi:DNA-binding NarL/FixJ family response regulator